MPNPNYSELRLIAKYGESVGANPPDGQDTNIYKAISDDSDEIDHKFLYGVDWGGQYVELVHYASVKQVVVQNIGQTAGLVFYIDSGTTALVPNWVVGGQHISFCAPDTAIGMFMIAGDPDESTDWHLAFCGRKD
jgi:hypothetical protein